MHFTYNPEATRSPIQDAYSTYRKLRRRGYRRLNHFDRMRYMFCRQYMYATKHWNRSQRDDLIERMVKSAASTGKWVEKWEGFLAWMEAEVRPTPERFAAVRGHSAEGTSTVMDGKGTVQNSEVFESDVRLYNFFYNKVAGLVEEISDHYHQATDTEGLEDLEHGEQLMANLIEEIEMGAAGLGLDPHPVFSDGSDGAVWFIDPDTNHEYFLLLNNINSFTKGDVATFIVPITYLGDQWKRTSLQELTHYGLAVNRTKRNDPTRPFRDYFGAFNGSTRLYMEGAANEAPVDWD